MWLYCIFTFIVYQALITSPNWEVSEVRYVDWDYSGYLEDTLSAVQPTARRKIKVNVTFENPMYQEKPAMRGKEWPYYPNVLGYRVPLCNFPEAKFLSGRNSDSQCMEEMIINLNRMNLTYHIDHKSLVGAYRHGGNMPGDDILQIGFYMYYNKHMPSSLDNHFCERMTMEAGERSKDDTLCSKTYEWWASEWAPQTINENMERIGFDQNHWRSATLEVHGSQPTTFEGRLMCPNRPYGRKPLHVKFRTRLFDANGYDVCACKFGSVYGMCKRRTKRYLNKVFPDRQKTGMKDWLYKYKAPDHEFFHTEYMNDTRTLELAKEWELQQDTAQAVYHDRAANHGRRKHDHQQ